MIREKILELRGIFKRIFFDPTKVSKQMIELKGNTFSLLIFVTKIKMFEFEKIKR